MKDVPRNLKRYFVCLLLKGDKWNETEGSVDLAPLHLAYLRKQVESRQFVFTGPLVDDGHMVGISLINAASEEEALALANEDPAVQAGRLAVEIHPAFLPSLDAVRVDF
jgi:uncharacterized protein YciI